MRYNIPTEIILLILEYYDFVDFADFRKISSVSRLFCKLCEKLIIKIFLINENNMRYKPIFKYQLLKNNIKYNISKRRHSNIRSIYYNWSTLNTCMVSYGSSYYKARRVEKIEYIIPKKIFYDRYLKFSYMIKNINEKEKFEVFHIISNKKFLIDGERGCHGLDLWKLGTIDDDDWHHCHDLSYHFTNLILKKLLIFKYLKSKNDKIKEMYEDLFKWE
ncbi:4832_t:CDS:2, partial [Scutellospora calospora]